MKNALKNNSFRAILKTRRRFFSILVMAFLGVGFYSGLVASSPDILDSLDHYVKDNKMYDVKVISTMGLDDNDIDAIKETGEFDSVYGIKSKDTLVKMNDKESVCKVIEYNENINKVTIIEGRMPEKDDECLLDKGYAFREDASSYLGQTISLENDDKDEEGNLIFKQKEFKVVGIVESPLYISSERGTSSIGSGTVSFYIYTRPNIINIDYYTEICTSVKNANLSITNSDEYLKLIEDATSKLEEIKDSRQEARYNSIIEEASKKVEDAKAEFNTNNDKVNGELEDAQGKINDAKTKIEDSENEIKTSKQNLANQETNLNTKFSEAKLNIQNAKKEIEENEKNLKNSETEFNSKKDELNLSKQKIDENINQLNSQLDMLKTQRETLVSNNMDTSEVDQNISKVSANIKLLESQKETIDNSINEASLKISNGYKEIQTTKETLDSKTKELESSMSTAYAKINTAKAQISSAENSLVDAKKELENKENEFNKNKEEALSKLQDAKKKIDDAELDIKKIEKGKWYIQDRNDNSGYVNILDAIKTMSNISKIFPLIFYIVAVLISLTSMTRMIEEERIEIGTLKALGYYNFQIISKYVIYALLACVVGGIFGMSVGLYLLPNIVWILYAMIYTIPKFYASYRVDVGLTGIVISFICIGGATILVAYKELKNTASALMRPKPPKNGKRILLEKVNFIWKKMNFSNKVTARNIFRYKKRAIMTIVGIAGCTGLMLTGFGIKDSVSDIPTAQFGGIFKYDASVTLTDSNNISKLEDYLNDNKYVDSYVEINAASATITGTKDSKTRFNVNVFVPEKSDEVNKVINLEKEDGTLAEISNDGIIISDKLSEKINAKQGDKVKFIDGNNVEYEFLVTSVVRNHVGHYVYMSKEFYEENIAKYDTNMILFNVNTDDESVQNSILSDILEIDSIASASMISTLLKTVSDMLNTMNYVVVILIVSSALLAFVVLYNLANINIGERQREIATLKVLGFYDNEVDSYINKENLIFTFIAVALGLVFGTFLTSAIISSIEIDSLKFMKNILVRSYIYSSIITVVFSIMVNFIIHFVLKKIDMIESLKSVE